MTRFAALALLRDGRVLLSKRSASRAFYPGVWDFPGGHCGAGEDYREAFLREAAEEPGILPTVYREAATIRRDGQFEAVLFAVVAWDGEVGNNAPEEHERLAWFLFAAARVLPLPDPEYSRLFDALEAGAV